MRSRGNPHKLRSNRSLQYPISWIRNPDASINHPKQILMMFSEFIRLPTVKRSNFFSKKDDSLSCLVCERGCLLKPGQVGVCGTRVNLDGSLYTLAYGDLSSVESRPIEIKPFYHFFPGSTALTFSTWSCNFSCPWCQNWHLSTMRPDPRKATYTPPEVLVRMALRSGDDGLCASFNEPTVQLEYTLDAFRLARDRGLYNTYVSNGYMTELSLKKLSEAGLDAIKIDIKGDAHVYREFLAADVRVPWRNAELAKMMKIHVEIVFLVVTGISDEENVYRDVIENHLKYLGPDTPLHVNRYFPAHKYHLPPTDLSVLEEIRRLAMREGIKFVYIGNVPESEYNHTYCPNCGRVLIKRYSYTVIENRIDKNGKCPYCGEEIPIIM